MIYAPLALMIAWAFFRWAVLSLDATNGLQDHDGRITRRFYTGLWVAFNLTTSVIGIVLIRGGWKLPQPIPPLVILFTAALWWGLFFISSGMLVKALIRRGGFGDPEGRLSQPLSPSQDCE